MVFEKFNADVHCEDVDSGGDEILPSPHVGAQRTVDTVKRKLVSDHCKDNLARIRPNMSMLETQELLEAWQT